ncbi:NgoFVII family restriction endonuclease [Listeria monocytogenes]|uniref:restriction endonuclease PLD domain-containing protein n=1 Tax=Listeria monocytogenes TaxID=1639 RepID=UPI000E7432BB|nr:restriction endonuclease PLD domain-containing protein [Listeria monocytogenes]EAE2451624.1 NgoFVII family restriction endonuclease [Listeria monocytogenes]EAF2233846.1 NgoFVII family restriction endonuclease [Listeria monocytogenes]EAG3579807.1 NgoFVII family restriction endonuclease [Listeria monocytogenes]EAW7172415.1 NgoFVII family restriction endonuclease [Listeria monocytogenes]EAW7207811.1 NgoFVII family restriction endonuclease [Listeria monocytogenes]
MEILYSNIPPMKAGKNFKTINDELRANIAMSDKIVFAVGYVSRTSLIELDHLIEKYNLRDVTLIIGMYSITGIPESIYIEVTKLQKKWVNKAIGNIYFVNNMNYHGKIYTFWKNGVIFKTIEGSANLSILSPAETTIRQYEIATCIEDPTLNVAFSEHIDLLKNSCASSASNLNDFKIVHESVESLIGFEDVTHLTESNVTSYQDKQTNNIIKFPIKAPSFDKRFSNVREDCVKSNINVCYGRGRKNSKGEFDPRNWYETQITVGKKIWSLSNYPIAKPFFVVTDDGYKFQAHTTSDNHKQFTAYDNDRILGRWIKGRLVANGLLSPIDDVSKDTNHSGVVTKEMLQQSNMEMLVLTKTNIQELGRVYKRKANSRLDKKSWHYECLDVWTIHFENNKGDKL